MVVLILKSDLKDFYFVPRQASDELPVRQDDLDLQPGQRPLGQDRDRNDQVQAEGRRQGFRLQSGRSQDYI